MKNVSGDLKKVEEELKKLLPAEDVLTFPFCTERGLNCTVIFADPLTDKELLGDQVVRPLLQFEGKPTAEEISKKLTFTEQRKQKKLETLAEEILAGNPVLLWEGMDEGIIVGTKKVFVRGITEPPTDIAIKGPREGFIEDIKINTSLVRKRFKSENLRIEFVKVGKISKTFVAVCYLEGTSEENVVKEVKEKLSKIDIDYIPDSSYLTHFLASRPKSLTKQVGATEKPDIFCAKIAEGRVGILVDGSPIALTVPYLLVEDFQSSEDYFVPSYRATFTRLLRLFALFLAIYIPAFYVAAQLFKLQLFPVKLLLTIAGSIRDLPFSPSLEMLLVLVILEILNEASIRMPKYVGMALSVVGALVLGESVFRRGFKLFVQRYRAVRRTQPHRSYERRPPRDAARSGQRGNVRHNPRNGFHSFLSRYGGLLRHPARRALLPPRRTRFKGFARKIQPAFFGYPSENAEKQKQTEAQP